MISVDSRETVMLHMPARPPNARLARLTAAAVGSRIGFGLEYLDDLRMAVDELCFCLMGDQGTDDSIVLTFFPVPDGLCVEGNIRVSSNEAPRGLPDLSRRIFDALTTSYDYKLDGPERWFKIMKRMSL